MLDRFQVAYREAAAVLASRRARKILLSLVQEEQSLSQLSRVTEVTLNLLHHHIRRMMRVGLVKVSRKETRAGAPIKYYRAVAREFYVPAELMSTNPGCGLTSQLRQLLDRRLAQSIRGMAYFHDGKSPRMRMVQDSDARTAAAELWMELQLSEEDAAELAEKLRFLLNRFAARSKSMHRRYLVHAAIVPFLSLSSRSRAFLAR